MLAGNLASLCTSALICGISSWLWPADFDFAITGAINADKHAASHPPPVEPTTPDADSKDEKAGDLTTEGHLMSAQASVNEASTLDENEDPVKLRAAFRLAVTVSVVLFVVLILLIPLPLFFSSHIYPKVGFYVWIIVTFTWVFYGAFAVVVYPLFESRQSLASIGGAIWRDLTGKSKKEVSAM